MVKEVKGQHGSMNFQYFLFPKKVILEVAKGSPFLSSLVIIDPKQAFYSVPKNAQNVKKCPKCQF